MGFVDDVGVVIFVIVGLVVVFGFLGEFDVGGFFFWGLFWLLVCVCCL